MKGLLKLAGRATGIIARNDAGAAVQGRNVRLAVTALVVAVLVWLGLPEPVATALVDLIAVVLSE